MQTAAGIILPESRVKKNEGEIVEVGPGAFTSAGERFGMDVAVGDHVLLPEYGGAKVELSEQPAGENSEGPKEEFFLYRSEDILGKFER